MSSAIIYRSCLFSLLAFFLAAQALAAQGSGPVAPASPANSGPVEIESDRMETGEQQNSVVFSGRVVARQGDLVIHADEMTIFYLGEAEKARQPQGDSSRLQKLHADGNVKIQGPEWSGTGGHMEYFEGERKLYLSGKAQVRQGDNLVTGEAVTMYLDEGRSVVESGSQPQERVRAFFYTGSSEGGKEPGADAPGERADPLPESGAEKP